MIAADDLGDDGKPKAVAERDDIVVRAAGITGWRVFERREDGVHGWCTNSPLSPRPGCGVVSTSIRRTPALGVDKPTPIQDINANEQRPLPHITPNDSTGMNLNSCPSSR